MASGEISYGTTYTYYPTTGTFIYPATFTYPGNEHQSKCINCGFCPCCGRTDVREEGGPAPDVGDNGGVHRAGGA